MRTHFIIGLSLLIAVTFVHLFFCFKENEKGRHWSKLFIMPLLAFSLFALTSRELPLYLGILFGWIGDIFLIFKKRSKWFLLFGLIAFLMGHALYIAEIVRLLSFRVPWVVYVVVAGIGIVFVAIGYRLVHERLGRMAIPASFYAFTLLIMASSALVLCVNYLFLLGPIFVLLGCLAFICSDFLIAYTYFYRDIRRRDFFIMIPYVLAEAGITIGIAILTLL